MSKQSASRSLRSKRFKVKHAVQICLLFVVGIWLLYRAKHSHAKRPGYEATASFELSEKKTRGAYQVLKLGRKDLMKPGVEETKVAVGEERHKEEEEETGNKDEDARVDAARGGDDEVEWQEQYRFEDSGADLADDFSNDDDDGDSDNDDEDENDDVGIDKKSREALEEHYKGDDASSAVFQNSQTVMTNNENRALRSVVMEQLLMEKGENDELRKENQYHRMEDADEDINDSKPYLWSNKSESFRQTVRVSAVKNEEKIVTDSEASHFQQSNESLARRAVVSLESIQPRDARSLGNVSNMPIVMVDHNPNSTRTLENEQLNHTAALPSTASVSDENNRDMGAQDTPELSSTNENSDNVLMESLDSWDGDSDF